MNRPPRVDLFRLAFRRRRANVRILLDELRTRWTADAYVDYVEPVWADVAVAVRVGDVPDLLFDVVHQ